MYQKQVTYKQAVRKAIVENYCNFSGRASRSEFWWFVLFTFILNLAISFVSGFVAGLALSDTEALTDIMVAVPGLVSLALLLPSLGISVRRLHDTDKSGWWILLSLIPFIGSIILLVFWCTDSQMQPNQYGPVPNLVEGGNPY